MGQLELKFTNALITPAALLLEPIALTLSAPVVVEAVPHAKALFLVGGVAAWRGPMEQHATALDISATQERALTARTQEGHAPQAAALEAFVTEAKASASSAMQTMFRLIRPFLTVEESARQAAGQAASATSSHKELLSVEGYAIRSASMLMVMFLVLLLFLIHVTVILLLAQFRAAGALGLEVRLLQRRAVVMTLVSLTVSGTAHQECVLITRLTKSVPTPKQTVFTMARFFMMLMLLVL